MSTGWIGVPIHEFGHAFFCVFFRHKIVEVKWFQPNTTDGTLGYVRHSFDKKNVYHQIGNFFIGVGPLLFGSLAILLLMFLFVPNSGMVAAASKVRLGDGSGFWAVMADYWSILWKVFVAIFNYHNFSFILWWIFFAFACSIAMHMDLSWADIKGMLCGLIYIVILMFILNFFLCLIKVKWAHAVTRGCLWLSVSVVSFMALAVLLLLILVAVCGLTKFIKIKIQKRIQKNKKRKIITIKADPVAAPAQQ